MKHPIATGLLCITLLTLSQESTAENAVVLVVGTDSPIEQMSTLDIRKVYLGIAVTVDGGNLRALHVQADDRLNQIFLQSVIAMSRKTYERRLLSSALQYGRPRPKEVADAKELVEAITDNHFSVGYMWKKDAESDSRVKIIKVLWQGT